jgi:hypothetical protein
VLAVLWAAPILEQLGGHPGNIHRFLSWTLQSRATLGLTSAIGVTGKQLSLPPPWINGRDSGYFGLLTASTTEAVLQLALCAGLAWLSWRRRERAAALLATMSLVAVGAGTLSVARIAGLPFTYLARYMWVVGMFLTLSTGWCVIRLVKPLVDRHRRTAHAVALGLALAAAVVLTVSTTLVTVTSPGWRTGWPITGEGVWPPHGLPEGVQALLPQLQRSIRPDRAYFLQPVEPNILGAGLGVGLQSALEARGYHVYLPPAYALEDGAWRTTEQHRTDATLSVVAHVPSTASFVQPAWISIAHWDPPHPFSGAAPYDVYLH